MVNLHESLGKAYDNSDRIRATRDQFLNDIETFPEALADFLPDISVSALSSDSTTKYKTPVQQAPIKQKTTQKSLNINQSIFSGGSGIAGLKAAQSARAARGNFYDKEQQGILEATQTYLNCYAAKEKYKISESSVNYNTKQVEAALARLELGEATKLMWLLLKLLLQ